MKIKNKLLLLWSIFALIIPINTLAITDKVILGGENVGIEIDTNGVLIVGFYKINNKSNIKNLKLGDRIIKVNDKDIDNIEEMIDIIDNSKTKTLNLTIIRNKKQIKTTLELEYTDNVYKVFR